MISIFSAYSFIFIALGFALIAAIILLSNKPKWNDYLAFGVIVGGLTFAWIILHPRPTILMDEAKQVQATIGSGKPVLLEFQSPY